MPAPPTCISRPNNGPDVPLAHTSIYTVYNHTHPHTHTNTCVHALTNAHTPTQNTDRKHQTLVRAHAETNMYTEMYNSPITYCINIPLDFQSVELGAIVLYKEFSQPVISGLGRPAR